MANCTTISLLDYIQSLPEATELSGDEQLLAIQDGQAYVVTLQQLQKTVGVGVLTFTGNGGDTYTMFELIGSTILDQFVGTSRMLSSGIVSHNETTGEVVFSQPIDSGEEIALHITKHLTA